MGAKAGFNSYSGWILLENPEVNKFLCWWLFNFVPFRKPILAGEQNCLRFTNSQELIVTFIWLWIDEWMNGYACIYVCTYVHTYVRMYVCMYVCKFSCQNFISLFLLTTGITGHELLGLSMLNSALPMQRLLLWLEPHNKIPAQSHWLHKRVKLTKTKYRLACE